MQVGDIKFGERINDDYTCNGKNISPPIKWKDAPSSTKEIVIFLDDPDAPKKSFNHWCIRNIQSSISKIHENVNKIEKTEEGWIQLENDFGKKGYDGPCPQGNKDHKYIVTVYALVRSVNEEEAKDIEILRKNCELLLVKKITWMFTYGKK
jgi:Raf kinase inhibitor-like YbhB/YbcL family protein